MPSTSKSQSSLAALAGVTLLVVAGASPAMATLTTATTDYVINNATYGAGNSRTVVIDVTKFDASLGNLVAINFNFLGNTTLKASVQNTSGSSVSGAKVNSVAQLYIYDSATTGANNSFHDFLFGRGANLPNLASGATTSVSAFSANGISDTRIDAETDPGSLMANLTGTGTFGLAVKLTVGAETTAPGSLVPTINQALTFGGGTVSISYEYEEITGPVPVPEAQHYAMMLGFGCMTVAATRQIRARKRA